jgi:hypothetical protein
MGTELKKHPVFSGGPPRNLSPIQPYIYHNIRSFVLLVLALYYVLGQVEEKVPEGHVSNNTGKEITRG